MTSYEDIYRPKNQDGQWPASGQAYEVFFDIYVMAHIKLEKETQWIHLLLLMWVVGIAAAGFDGGKRGKCNIGAEPLGANGDNGDDGDDGDVDVLVSSPYMQ